MSWSHRPFLLCLAVATIGACQQTSWPDTRVGLNQPPPGTVPTFSWWEVTGASAYQVTVYMDRGATLPVGTTGFTSATQMPVDRVTWQEGHPVLNRPYFWFVRAYDRPDPTGLLIATRGPEDIAFDRFFPTPAPVAPLPAPTPGASAPATP